MPEIVVFGAGKIARGFLGHLLSLSGLSFLFIEKDPLLASSLRERGEYSIHVMGHPEKDCTVRAFRAFHSDREVDQYLPVLAQADLVFTSVGGNNLKSIAQPLAVGYQVRRLMRIDRPMNVISCENWIDSASVLRRESLRWLPEVLRERFTAEVGIAESVVLRSAIDPAPERKRADPLAVNVQDYWTLPVDGAGIVGALPRIEGLEVKTRFAGMLTRKLYTYNAGNGTVSYLGHLKGYTRIDEAVADREILDVLNAVYEESSFALSREFGIPYDEQYEFAMSSLAKLRDPAIVDTISRNARDPIRKLGPTDRLVGPALLCLKHGRKPEGLATAIAAAIHYDDPGDPAAVELARARRDKGYDHILDAVCGLGSRPELKALIALKIRDLEQRGWIKP